MARGETTDHRALLVFAKAPVVGQVKTRLGKDLGMDEAARVYDELARHTFAIARTMSDAGIHLWVFHTPESSTDTLRQWAGLKAHYHPQTGHDLGTRMMTAFDTVFAAGATRALIIGTDVPELSNPVLDDAFAALDTADIVIGPGRDGGYYLLGMCSPTKPLFQGIAWSSDSVLGATISCAERLGLKSKLLSPLADIDTLDDYRAWKERTGKHTG